MSSNSTFRLFDQGPLLILFGMSHIHIVAPKTTPPQFQGWLDAVVEAARKGAPGDWPHAHPDLPSTEITMATFKRAVEANFESSGEPWSLERHGLPPLPGEDADHKAGDPDPNKGSSYHNLMHSLLGDFH
jgi:hypothetical protein